MPIISEMHVTLDDPGPVDRSVLLFTMFITPQQKLSFNVSPYNLAVLNICKCISFFLQTDKAIKQTKRASV